jgi:protein-S-isoprenylcysteine O-methyltransferase Ste14
MFRIIALIIFVVGLLISGYHRRKAETSGERVSWKEENPVVMVLLRISGLALWVSVILYMINPRWMRWAQLEIPQTLRWVGVAIGTVSLPLLYWLFSSIGTNITQTVATKKEHELITHGPYRWVRHPLYSVGTLLFIAFALMAANWFIGLASLVVFVMLMIRLPKEEEKLIERFGDEYRAYMKRTGRFFPRLGVGRSEGKIL